MRISTGSTDFDEWLDGGYDADIITTIYGPAGSGKTNLCLMATVAQASKGKKVIFVDTEGGFSLSRLNQLASHEVMKNILLFKVTNFNEQTETFSKLLNLLKKDIGLVVVDSMVMLYRLEIGEANQEKNTSKIYEINEALAKQMRILNEIARKKQIPVIITNQVYSEFLNKEDFESGKEKRVSMVGGDILKYWSKCIIELQNIGENRKRAILKKHRNIPEKYFIFNIFDKGIIKEKKFRFF